MSDKLKLFLILGSIILILGGLIVYDTYKDYLHSNPDDTIGNTAGNLNNGGFVCQVDDKVYFANSYDDNRLYVMNLDETGMKCLTDSSVYFINADKRNVYYYVNSISSVSGMGGFTMSTLGLYRTNIKGGQTKCLEKVTCGVVKLIGNDLYYQRYHNDEGISLQKMDVRSKESEAVMRYDANPASFAGSKIYYCGSEEDHYIYEYDLTTGLSIMVCDINAWNVDYENGYIYFMNIDDNYCLYRYNVASQEAEKLTNERCDAYIYCNDYLVYQRNSKTDPMLMMMPASGGEAIELVDGNYAGFGAANGTVYFTEYGLTVPMYKVAVGGSGRVEIFQAAADAALSKKKKHNK